MSDDGSGGDITIPSMLMFKQDADPIREALMENTPVRINLVNPGATATAMRRQAMPGEDPSTLTTPDQVADALLKVVSPDWFETAQVYQLSDLLS